MQLRALWRSLIAVAAIVFLFGGPTQAQTAAATTQASAGKPLALGKYVKQRSRHARKSATRHSRHSTKKTAKKSSASQRSAKAKNTVAARMDRPANGLPEDLREHARLMCDIIAIAFQTDQTRVASLLISRDLSAMYYPFLSVKEGHHAASHDNTSAGYERIARFHVEHDFARQPQHLA